MDYLEIPERLTYEDIENSVYLRSFFEGLSLEQKKIDLYHLRDLYIKNRQTYNSIVDEMALRGFKFSTSKPNNVLPKYNIQNANIRVKKNMPGKNYKNIDFERLGISNFTTRFSVKDDLFFNNIPIEGFLYLNRDIDCNKVISEFIDCGFDVTGVVDEINKEKYDEVNYAELDLEDLRLTIKSYNWLVKNGINSILEFIKLDSQIIKNYGGIDRKSINEMCMIVEELIGSNKEKSKESTVNKTIITHDEKLFSSINIDTLGFSKRAYNSLRRSGIEYLSELVRVDDETLLNIRNLGVKTLKEIQLMKSQIIENGIEINTDKLIDGIDNKPVSELGLSAWSYNALKSQGIRYVSELLELDMHDTSNVIIMGEKAFEEIRNKITKILENKNKIKTMKSNEGVENKSHNEELELENRIIKNILDSKLILELGFSVRANNALKRQGLNYVSELLELDSEEIKSIKNIGEKTAEEILLGVEKYKASKSTNVVEISEDIIEYYGEIKILNLDIELIDCMIKIKELKDKPYTDLLDELGEDKFIILISKLKELKTFKQITEKIKLSEREACVLESTMIKGNTLEETGSLIDVTRERVRQIKSKSEMAIIKKLKNNGYLKMLKILNQNKKTCSGDIVRLSFNENELLYHIIKKSKLSPLTYEENIDSFFFDGTDGFKSEISMIISNQEDLFYMIDVLDDFLEISINYDISLDMNHVESLLSNQGCYLYGELVSKNKLTTIEIISILFKDYIDGSLRMDEEGYEHCKELAERYLNFTEMTTSLRGLDNRMREEENLILVDKLTYKHISKIKYDIGIINEIDKYLEEKMQDNEVINIVELIEDNKLKIENTELNNKRLIYSLLKRELGYKYKFGKKNTLNIYADDIAAESSNRDVLKDYLLRKNNRANKDDILIDLKWTSVRLDNTILNYDEFISVGNKIIKYYPRITISDSEKEKLDELIQRNLVDGYIGVGRIFIDMKFDVYLNQFIQNNEIENSLVLSQILKIVYPEYVGHSSILFQRNSPYRNIEDIIIDKFTLTTRDEISKFISELGHSDLAIYPIILKLLSKGKYIEISEDELLREDLFSLDEEIINEVEIFIDDYYEKKGYVALKSISGYRSVLPKIKHKWNPHLIRAALLKSNYRDVKMKIRDYRSDRLIMVKKSSEVRTFEELCYKLIKSGYIGNMHESSIYDYLTEAGLLNEKDSFSVKILPFELRKGELIKVDEIGKVILR